MNSILEAFANRNITVEPQSCWRNPDYKEAIRLALQNREKLSEKLNEEEQELLEKYIDARTEEYIIENDDRFIHGFKLGLILTAEAFVTGGDLIDA